MLDADFLEIAYGILLNGHTDAKKKLLWLLDNLTLESDKIWLKIDTEYKFLFNCIVDISNSNDI